jgi:hypothetical protein
MKITWNDGPLVLNVTRVKIGSRIRKSDIWDLSDDLHTVYCVAGEHPRGGVGTKYVGLMPLYRIKA